MSYAREEIAPMLHQVLAPLCPSGTDVAGGGNPLRDVVRPGDRVLIKPNFVLDWHPLGKSGLDAMVAHTSIVGELARYAMQAVGRMGRVSIADTPLESCRFDQLVEQTGLQRMLEAFTTCDGGTIELLDLRTYRTDAYPDGSVSTVPLPGDPRGYTTIDLGAESFLEPLHEGGASQNYHTLGDHTVDPWDPAPTEIGLPNQHHHAGVHRYRIGNTILQSDVIINISKLKTHKKSGVTLSMKNCIGLAQGKEFLPHHRPGMPTTGGDSFPSAPSRSYLRRMKARRGIARFLGATRAARMRDAYRRIFPYQAHKVKAETMWGDWFGNDTIWRTTLDLNLIQLYGHEDGVLNLSQKRRYLGVIDGIVGMDHEAPMNGLPKASGLLVTGTDPVAVDTLGCFLMGFDPRRIPTIRYAGERQGAPLGEGVVSLAAIWSTHPISDMQDPYQPTRGWMSHLLPHTTHWPDTS